MNVSRIIIAAAMAIATMPVLITAQQGRTVEVPRAASFEISPGRMFSASAGSKRKAAAETKALAPLASSVVSDIAEAAAIIRANHASAAKIDGDQLTSSSISEMLRTLDPHSRYFSRNEYAELMGEHRSEYHGTGITIAEFESNGTTGVYVISVAPESPAAAAGLKFGDRIVTVENNDVSGRGSNEIRQLIRGPQGTEVRLGVSREGSGRPLNVVMRRERLAQRTISDSYIIGGNIGYIALDGGFSFSTAAEFSAALTDLKKAGVGGLLIDLRGNSGGIFEQAVEIAEIFLPAGARIVSQRARDEGNEQAWVSVNRSPETLPLVILVDSNTASASEILAGAMQDNDRAIIVGERTFGKGLVQNVIELPDGSGLTLTSARYYTPAGRSIQRDYSDVGLYDYFRHTKQGSTIAGSSNAVRTITNRPVFGGDGIAPDVASGPKRATAIDQKINDAAFLSVRQALNAGRAEQTPQQFHDEMRRKILFNEDPADDAGVSSVVQIAGFADAAAAKNLVGIRERLRYHTALALFGYQTAERFRVADDPAVKTAVANLPAAAKLSTAAESLRASKKAR